MGGKCCKSKALLENKKLDDSKTKSESKLLAKKKSSKNLAKKSKSSAGLTSKSSTKTGTASTRTPTKFGASTISTTKTIIPSRDKTGQVSVNAVSVGLGSKSRPPWIKYVNSKNPYIKHEHESEDSDDEDEDNREFTRLDLDNPYLINKVLFENKHAPRQLDDSICCPCPFDDCYDDDCNNNSYYSGPRCNSSCNYDPCKQQRSCYCQNISSLCQNHQFSTVYTRRNCNRNRRCGE